MNIENKNLPVMMYVHGFMSGANGAKQRQLQKHFKNRYRVIAPELDADPDKSLDILNNIIADECPAVIVGTSLGGWMTLMCDSCDAELVIVNPALFPHITLARWLNEPQEYFCQRLDGVQTYTLTREVLDKYLKYDAVGEVKNKLNRTQALCSTKDELIGSRHIEALTPIMPQDRLTIVDDFGHQCRDAGMKHLYGILDGLYNPMVGIITTAKNIPWQFSITSGEGKSHYYDPMIYCRECCSSGNPKLRNQPTPEHAKEYLSLRGADKCNAEFGKMNWNSLNLYEHRFDWRDIVTGSEGAQGLISPEGKKLLPEIFQTVRRQSISIIHSDDLIPVSNGEGIGLALPSDKPVMLTPFKYRNVITERWEHEFYFVQSKETGKWGALRYGNEFASTFDKSIKKRPDFVKVLQEYLPCEFDEIYEDQICTDCSPTLFWVFRKGDKLGILTEFGHTEAIYDGYETDCVDAGYTLYCNGIQMVIEHSLSEDRWQ